MEEVKFKYGRNIKLKSAEAPFNILESIDIEPYRGDIYSGIISFLLEATKHPETIRFCVRSSWIWDVIKASKNINKLSMKDCHFVANDNLDGIPLKLNDVIAHDDYTSIAHIYALSNNGVLTRSLKNNKGSFIRPECILTVDLVETLNMLLEYDTQNVCTFISTHPEIQLETGAEAITILQKYCKENQRSKEDGSVTISENKPTNQTLHLIRSIDIIETESVYFTCDFLNEINSKLMSENKQYVICDTYGAFMTRSGEIFFRICDLSFDMSKPVGYILVDKDSLITEIVIPDLYHQHNAPMFEDIINRTLKTSLELDPDDMVQLTNIMCFHSFKQRWDERKDV